MDTAALLEVLAEEYGAKHVRLTPFFAAPDHAIYRVDRADGAAWVLRHLSIKHPDVEGDAEILRIVRHLPVEQLVETRDGRGTTRAAGRSVIVTRLEAGPPATPSPTILRQVGATLGAVHQLQPQEITRWADSLPREDLSLARRYLADIADDVPADQRGPYERLQRDLAATNDCEDLPHTLVHSDCHLANVIDAPRGAVLIDWQGAGQGPALASLGWFLYSAAVQSPEGPATAFEPARVAAVLSGYGQYRTLTQAELLRLADAIRFRPLVIATREFRQSIKARTPATAIGWWSRYTEAEAVAQRALRYYEDAR